LPNPLLWRDMPPTRPTRPEPEPVQTAAIDAGDACPKLMWMRKLIAEEEEAAKAQTNQARRQSAAIERWRHASPGDGNGAVLRLGHDLNRIGMNHAES
jgi:hypothetical protein